MLRRFWITFEKASPSDVFDMGCGITAYDLRSAEHILREKVFPIYGERKITEIKEDVNVSTLEERHIRPNMGNPAIKGVWFPLL